MCQQSAANGVVVNGVVNVIFTLPDLLSASVSVVVLALPSFSVLGDCLA